MKYRVMFKDVSKYYDEIIEADDVREALIEADLDEFYEAIEFGQVTVEPVYE
tara:strand:+ start:355 stop:510 length:156 start_codon:yes stop_codon:yes gene_type:complete